MRNDFVVNLRIGFILGKNQFYFGISNLNVSTQMLSLSTLQGTVIFTVSEANLTMTPFRFLLGDQQVIESYQATIHGFQIAYSLEGEADLPG